MKASHEEIVGSSDDSSKLGGAGRVLATLSALGAYPEGVGLNDLARVLNSPRSSVHRALATLRTADLIEQGRDGRYRLGYGLLKLAFSYYEELDEVGRIRPMLSGLASKFGETSHYAILDGPEVVYLAKVQPPASHFHMTSVIGGRNPAFCTGVGKALLAYDLTTEAAVSRFVRANHDTIVRHTTHTITSAKKLHRELSQIREVGYALDREENEPGINCLAIPLFLTSKSVPDGAVSITAVAHRMPLEELEASVDEARDIITEYLGEVTL